MSRTRTADRAAQYSQSLPVRLEAVSDGGGDRYNKKPTELAVAIMLLGQSGPGMLAFAVEHELVSDPVNKCWRLLTFRACSIAEVVSAMIVGAALSGYATCDLHIDNVIANWALHL